jgi:glycerol-3-phosphate dehydrogenase
LRATNADPIARKNHWQRMTDLRHHVIVIGGGVVVLGVALEITRRIPSQQLLVLEKEDRVAR